MENTCNDFWKMVVQRGCGVIVMLCDTEENGQVMMVGSEIGSILHIPIYYRLKFYYSVFIISLAMHSW